MLPLYLPPPIVALYTVHKILIVSAIILFAGFAIYGFSSGSHQESGDRKWLLILAGLSAASAVCLVFYFRWFLRRTRV